MEIGKYCELTVSRATRHGAYLTDEQGNEVLLPKKFVSDTLRLEDKIEVFIFTDSEDRVTATTLKPKITLGEFAFLQVKDVNRFGAFMEWGLEKDLFLPFKEQPLKVSKGQWLIVYLDFDAQSNRLVASGRWQRYLIKGESDLKKGQEVEILGAEKSDLGINVIINNRYSGLVYEDDIYEALKIGDRKKGFVKNIRPDFKIDITLKKPGYAHIESHSQRILDKLASSNGFLAISDKTNPQIIKKELAMSKKTFKKAVGTLYKKRLIVLKEEGIYLKKR